MITSLYEDFYFGPIDLVGGQVLCSSSLLSANEKKSTVAQNGKTSIVSYDEGNSYAIVPLFSH